MTDDALAAIQAAHDQHCPIDCCGADVDPSRQPHGCTITDLLAEVRRLKALLGDG